MKRLLPLAGALLLSGCASHGWRLPHFGGPAAPASAAASGLPGIHLAYRKTVLANGLTLIVHEDHKAPVAAVDVWYHVGSKDEPAGRHGFAHLFEHLMFNGSRHFNDEYFRGLEPAGATDINGTTSYDRTNFFETVPISALTRALWMESDRMHYLLGAVDQHKLDEQRGVVENEKRQDENQPYGQVPELIARATYPVGHPYSWTPIGSVKDLNAATLADVRAWFHKYYGAANATVVVAGDVDAEAVEAQVERMFGDVPPGPALSHAKVWVAPMRGERRQVVYAAVPQARLYLVWNVPPAFTADAAYLQLAADVLASGKSSRLYRRLVHDDNLATAVSAGLDDREIGSQFDVEIDVRDGVDPAAVEQATEEEIAKLLANGPDAAELDRVRADDFAGLLRGLQYVQAQADVLARSEVYTGSPDAYARYLNWLRAATPTDVRDAARNWLADGDYLLWVRPQPPYHASGHDVDRSGLPVLGAPPPLKLPALQRFKLDDGLKVVLAARPGSPLVAAQLIVNAGYAADAGVRSGTAQLTFQMLSRGARGLDPAELDRRLQSLGASLDDGESRDGSYLTLAALHDRFADALALFGRVVSQPSFDRDRLDRFKRRLLAAIAQERASPQGAVRRVLSRLLFGAAHPYAFAGLGLPQDVEAITPADLQAFYRRWVRPDNATLLVVGDFTPATLRPLLERAFAEWRAPAGPPPVKRIPPVVVPTGQRIYLIDKPGAEQSYIAAADLVPPPSTPGEEARQALDAVVGGMFVSRLNLDLREARHWSYGAFSDLIEARHASIFYAGASVESGRTADAMRAMAGDLQAVLGARPVTAAELAAAKATLTRSLPAQTQSVGQVAGLVAHLLEFRLPDNYYNRYVDKTDALTPTQVEAVAPQMIKPQSLTWVVVGDLRRIQAPIEALGLGPVTVINADGRVLSTPTAAPAVPVTAPPPADG